jgi:hypothetical protein
MAAVDLEAWREEFLVLPQLEVEALPEGRQVDVERGQSAGARGGAPLVTPGGVRVVDRNVARRMRAAPVSLVPHDGVGHLELCKQPDRHTWFNLTK